MRRRFKELFCFAKLGESESGILPLSHRFIIAKLSTLSKLVKIVLGSGVQALFAIWS